MRFMRKTTKSPKFGPKNLDDEFHRICLGNMFLPKTTKLVGEINLYRPFPKRNFHRLVTPTMKIFSCESCC